jgi:hypothetical protein
MYVVVTIYSNGEESISVFNAFDSYAHVLEKALVPIFTSDYPHA